jgi:DNA topoisomerase-1
LEPLLEEALIFSASKDLGEYKGEEVQVSNGRYGPYIRHGAAFVSLPGRKSFRCRF